MQAILAGGQSPQLVAASGPRPDIGRPASGPAKKINVLIVEDDFLVAADLEHEFNKQGFEVAGIAASAQQAVELARATKPTIAIMDVRLAGDKDGVDAAIELFREHKIRSFFATAHSDENTKTRAAAASPLGWIAKPYTAQSLIVLVKKALA
jgi:DNA-binding NarL/FixJ family response regulator